jgi:CheY-like chemotaxis protein
MAIKHALVVDDSKSARFSLSKMLQQAGLSVDMVESGEAALEYLREQRPDVVFMDHMMPGLDGLAAAKAIKDNPATKMIPVVMSTSKEGDDYIQEVKAHGAISILPKPSKSDELAAVLEDVSAHINLQDAQTEVSGSKPHAAEVETMPRENIAELVQSEVQTQIVQQAATQLARLQQDLQSEIQSATQQISQELQETIRHTLTQESSDALQQQIEERISTLTQEVTEDVYTQHSQELDNRIRKILQHQLLEFKADLATTHSLNSATQQEINNLAQATAEQRASEIARQIAQGVAEKVATQSAQKVAQQTAESVTTKLLNETLESNRPAFGPVYAISILALVMSGFAALGVYFLH